MRMRNAVVAAAFSLSCAPLFAAPVILSNITASWLNPVPPEPVVTIANGNPTSSVRWGDPFFPNVNRSGYDFTRVATGTAVFNVPPDSPPVDLGVFNHLNFPITGATLQSISLQINADISVDGAAQGNFDFLFDLTHVETTNGDNPCQFGGANNQGVNINGCADRVSVSPNVDSEQFLVNGVLYTLDILGFSQDGGQTILNQFLTIENQDNHANLYARVRAVEQQVPEPGSLALVGLALLAVGITRRRSLH